MSVEKYVNARELAALIGVSTRTVKRMVAAGDTITRSAGRAVAEAMTAVQAAREVMDAKPETQP